MGAYRIVFEDAGYRDLLPLAWWRSVGELRCGRHVTIRRHLPAGEAGGLWVRPMLAEVAAERFAPLAVNAPAPPGAEAVLLLNARWLPDAAPPADGPPAVGVCDGQVAWLRLAAEQANELSSDRMLADDAPSADDWAGRLGRSKPAGGVMLRYPWNLVHRNAAQLVADWQADGGAARIDGKVYDGVYLLGEPGRIHIGAGSSIKPCTVIDAEDGPVWIGQDVRISPHALVQGPAAIGDGTLIQAGAVIREGTTIGPVCKVGGEVEESILWGYSNKQHDGFLGHAALGAWINIAADSINSDLKNTYGPVRVPINGVEVDSGQTFVGLTMGDHSKSSINASFSTGSVVGFCANVVCNAFPPKFTPSFCWLTDDGGGDYDVERGLAVAKKVMARRKVTMTAAEERLFRAIAVQCRRVEQSADLDADEA